MIYCTIYACEGKQNKIPASEKLYPFKCLSYTSKAEAESFKNTFIEEAKTIGFLLRKRLVTTEREKILYLI